MKTAMTKPDLIIFDCDGVLVDSEVLSCRCLSEVLAGYGITIGTEEIVRLFLGRNTAAVLQHYADAGRPIPSTFPDDFAARVRGTFRSAAMTWSASLPKRFATSAALSKIQNYIRI